MILEEKESFEKKKWGPEGDAFEEALPFIGEGGYEEIVLEVDAKKKTLIIKRGGLITILGLSGPMTVNLTKMLEDPSLGTRKIISQ